MPPELPPQRTQEQSIKARKHQLFDSEEPAVASGPRRSFQACLRETPADSLSPLVKGLLWAVGAVVVLLLVAALTTGGGGKKKPRPRPSPAASASEAGARAA